MGRTFRKGGREAEHQKFKSKKEAREKAEQLKKQRENKRDNTNSKDWE